MFRDTKCHSDHCPNKDDPCQPPFRGRRAHTCGSKPASAANADASIAHQRRFLNNSQNTHNPIGNSKPATAGRVMTANPAKKAAKAAVLTRYVSLASNPKRTAPNNKARAIASDITETELRKNIGVLMNNNANNNRLRWCAPCDNNRLLPEKKYTASAADSQVTT